VLAPSTDFHQKIAGRGDKAAMSPTLSYVNAGRLEYHPMVYSKKNDIVHVQINTKHVIDVVCI
jgi:hypothetical protein